MYLGCYYCVSPPLLIRFCLLLMTAAPLQELLADTTHRAVSQMLYNCSCYVDLGGGGAVCGAIAHADVMAVVPPLSYTPGYMRL